MLHLPDWSAIELPEHERNDVQRSGATARCARAAAHARGHAIGVLTLGRPRAAFSDKEIALVKLLPTRP